MQYLMACSDMPALKAAKDLYTDAVSSCAAMKTRQRARQFRIKEVEQFCSGCRVLVSTDPRPAESRSIYGSREREAFEIASVEDLYEQGLIAFRKNYPLPDTLFAFYSAAEIKPLNISEEQESRHESSVISSTYLGAILNAQRGLIVYRPQSEALLYDFVSQSSFRPDSRHGCQGSRSRHYRQSIGIRRAFWVYCPMCICFARCAPIMSPINTTSSVSRARQSSTGPCCRMRGSWFCILLCFGRTEEDASAPIIKK